MKTASVADIKAHFGAYPGSAAHGPVAVTRGGKPVGALPVIEDRGVFRRLVPDYSTGLRTLLNAARQHLRAGAGTPHEDSWQNVESGQERGRRAAHGRRRLEAAQPQAAITVPAAGLPQPARC